LFQRNAHAHPHTRNHFRSVPHGISVVILAVPFNPLSKRVWFQRGRNFRPQNTRRKMTNHYGFVGINNGNFDVRRGIKFECNMPILAVLFKSQGRLVHPLNRLSSPAKIPKQERNKRQEKVSC